MKSAKKLSAKDRERVREMAELGIDEEAIAKIHKVSVEELREQCEDELLNGATEATMNVARRLYKSAMGGSPPAMIFWMKARAGWSDKAEKKTVKKKDGTERVRRGTKKQDEMQRALEAETGQFKPAPAPLRLVKGNDK